MALSRPPVREPQATPPVQAPAGSSNQSGANPANKDRCPRCQNKLWVVTDVKWCPGCSYREKVPQRQPIRQAAAPAPTTWLGAIEFAENFKRIPTWVWKLGSAILVLAGVSVIGDILLPAKCLPRALWSTLQILAGIVGILWTNASAIYLLAPKDDGMGLGVLDMIYPERLWRLMVRRMPETRKHLCGAIWSVSLILVAVFCVGGLGYWLPSKKDMAKLKTPHVTQMAIAMGSAVDEEEAATLEEAINEVAGTKDDGSGFKGKTKLPPTPSTARKDSAKQPTTEKTAPEPKETSRFVITGYVVSGEPQQLTGVVVATLKDGQLFHAGVVEQGLTPEQRKDLLTSLAPLKAPTSPFPDLKVQATWVRPRLVCEIEHGGLNESFLLKSPLFKKVVVVEKKPATPGEGQTPTDKTNEGDPKEPQPPVGKPNEGTTKPS